MNPSDWVADCMVPDAWMHDPFQLDGAAVSCDGSALIAFPGRGKQYTPPRFDLGQERVIDQLRAALAVARDADTAPVDTIKDLGLNEQHAARLAAEEGLQFLVETTRIIFHAINTDTGELDAYGVIYRGAQRT